MIPANEEVNDSPMGGFSEEEVQTQELLQQLESIATNKPMRIIRKHARFADMVAYVLPIVADDIPITFDEATHSSKEENWRIAMN
ncbi:Retrovirus-related Pol polyprotein from transposon TNT 1-94 [Gossypium australe]|uniref:Retrovirus-related Pol polyprotein from transposon TNT 1-94 n=1 Tax=Gossypium australe TaxID=47621 RepID=A0A5B6UKD5_9ROSI|nr:Retrovirus-related Pol polyprotein from transposon TNT 1-94 [Gossypium australe]